MKQTQQINDTLLIYEILKSMVSEYVDLVWVLPYTKEVHNQVVTELFSQLPISQN